MRARGYGAVSSPPASFPKAHLGCPRSRPSYTRYTHEYEYEHEYAC